MSQSSLKPSETPADKNAYAGLWAVVLFAAAVGFYASLLVGWIVFPKLLYSKQNQPIDFNHVVHVGAVDDSCQTCHYFREDGSFAGMPATADCAGCHESMDSLQGENPQEKLFVQDYVEKDQKEVPWFIYSKQPPCVFFSHAAHVFSPKMRQFRDPEYQLPEEEVEEGAYDDTTCHVCHGFIGESEHNRPYEENRITGYSRDIWGENIAGIKKHTWERMKMDDCAECHEKVKGHKEACFVCHK
ncbi:MAG: menaquinone reductase multiheme cytochrome c subunit QrcA [Thermodesulfobacteriota bacterium]